MRWYFAIDEAGSHGQTGQDAKAALQSAAGHGLEPRLLYSGARNAFTAWMQNHGAEVIDAEPSFQNEIRAGEAAGTYRAYSNGHWLRLAIPNIEQNREFALYTDCDVTFLRRTNWAAIRPKVCAAGPEFRPDAWDYFNSGVMVLNIPAMRATYPACEAHIRARITSGNHQSYDDQIALNEVYAGVWERLDPTLNWKPYWPRNPNAAILHFHGPKLDTIEALTAGTWQQTNPTATQLAEMITTNHPNYTSWLTHLGDLSQQTNPTRALRHHHAATALARYGGLGLGVLK